MAVGGGRESLRLREMEKRKKGGRVGGGWGGGAVTVWIRVRLIIPIIKSKLNEDDWA